MSQRDLARLLVKIAALIILVTAFTSLPGSLSRLLASSHPRGEIELIGMTFAPASISMLTGLAMYWWAGAIVDRTLVGVSSGTRIDSIDLRGFEEIALTVLGFYLLSAGIAEAAYYLGRWFLYNDLTGDMTIRKPPMDPAELGGLLAAGTRIVLGALLVFFSRGFIAFKRRLLVLRPMQSNG